jgi:hypothetical protein
MVSRMKRLFMVLLLAGSTGAFTQPVEPAQVLFDTAVREEAHGRFERARLALVTLANTYYDSPLANKARSEVFALDLFLDAREKQQTGNARAAFVTYRTVAQVYPESPLAKQAEATSRALEPQSRGPVVRSISYRGFPVSQNQIARRFTEREVPLAVERPYEAAEVERAREILVQLLRDRGHGDLDVKVETENIPPRAIGITFTAAKK